jgi:hypothetical protein
LEQVAPNHGQIAREPGVSRQTIIRWLPASAYRHHPGGTLKGGHLGSTLDPDKPHLTQWSQEEREPSAVLWQEILSQEFQGSDS